MRKLAYTLAALLLVAPLAHAQPNLALKSEAERVAVVAKVKPSVVAVFAAGGQGGGTGVLISDDGYALTNFHVVQPTGPTTIRSMRVTPLSCRIASAAPVRTRAK